MGSRTTLCAATYVLAGVYGRHSGASQLIVSWNITVHGLDFIETVYVGYGRLSM